MSRKREVVSTGECGSLFFFVRVSEAAATAGRSFEESGSDPRCLGSALGLVGTKLGSHLVNVSAQCVSLPIGGRLGGEMTFQFRGSRRQV